MTSSSITNISTRTITLRELWEFINSVSSLEMDLIDARDRKELNKLEAIIDASWKFNEAVQLKEIEGLKP